MKTKEKFRGLVAQGWCTAKNEKKFFDPDLAEAITEKVYPYCVQLQDKINAALSVGHNVDCILCGLKDKALKGETK